MARSYGCFSALVIPFCSQKSKPKKQMFCRHKIAGPTLYHLPPYDAKLREANEEQSNHAYSAALAAAEVLRSSTLPRPAGKSSDEIASTKIQTAFRGYLARKKFRTLLGFSRLKKVTEGPSAKRQAAATLSSLHTLARMQAQIRSRRARMIEEHAALQRQLKEKHEREIHKMKTNGGGWDETTHSKEKVDAKSLQKQQAAVRRERALAYSFSISHQHARKASIRSLNAVFIDPTNPQWGWSLMERWMTPKPLENSPAKKFLSRVDIAKAHSVGTSSVRDDESLGTQNSKGKSRLSTPSGSERKNPLLFSGSPGNSARRISSSLMEVKVT